MRQVVIGLVDNGEGAFLSLQRSKGSEDSIVWSFPSGGVEDGEGEADAVAREVLEETGVVCLPVEKIGDRIVGDNQLHYWRCDYVSGTPRDPAPNPVTGIREVFNVLFRKPDELKTVMAPEKMFAPVRKLLGINI